MKSDQIKFILSAAVVASVILLSIILLFVPVPAANDKNFTTVVVALLGMAGTAVGYYFGSSQGSERKTELMAQPKQEGEGK